VLPFRQRVEARGERFGLAITQTFHNGGSTGRVPVWLLENPAEFAEYATSLLLYLKNAHGIEADYYVICKDAGDREDNPFEVAVVAEMIKSLGPRLRTLGLSTTVLFPECHDDPQPAAGRCEIASEQYHEARQARVPVRGQRRSKHRLGTAHGAGLSSQFRSRHSRGTRCPRAADAARGHALLVRDDRRPGRRYHQSLVRASGTAALRAKKNSTRRRHQLARSRSGPNDSACSILPALS
jgi:hypothetical protein